MNVHSDQHEELLRAVVVGDVTADSAQVLQRRRECDECAHLLAGMLRAAEALEADRVEQEELLGLAEQITDAPGEDRIAAFREHPEFAPGAAGAAGAAVRTARPRTLVRVGAVLASAAAVALVLFMIPRAGPDGAGGPEGPLGPRILGNDVSHLKALGPLGAVPDYGTFRWSVASELAPEVGYYVLVVRGEGLDEEVARLRETEWSDPQLTQDFPDAIEWWVVAYGAGEDELDSSEPVSARRSD